MKACGRHYIPFARCVVFEFAPGPHRGDGKIGVIPSGPYKVIAEFWQCPEPIISAEQGVARRGKARQGTARHGKARVQSTHEIE